MLKENSLEAHEVVHDYQRTYEPHYVLSQLLEWHNENRGRQPVQKLAEAFRGCVQLPDPVSCYKGRGVYDDSARGLLLQRLGKDCRKVTHHYYYYLLATYSLCSDQCTDSCYQCQYSGGTSVVGSGGGDTAYYCCKHFRWGCYC
jgi:Protein SET DOMAIN GROUP 2 C-terminal